MSYLFTDPRTVLVAGGSPGDGDLVRSALESAGEFDVETVDSVDAVVSAVEDRADVGCVVLLDGGVVAADGATSVERRASEGSDRGDSSPQKVEGRGPDVLAWCDSIRDRSETLPVVVVTGDDEVAGALATYRGCRHLPAHPSPELVRESVADAVSTYRDRRRTGAESDVFETLLREADVPMYVKDDEGRHVYKSALDGEDVTPEDVVGKTDLDLVDEGFLEVARRTYRDDMTVVETGEPIYEREERAGSGNDEYWSQTTKVPWRDDDGTVQGLVGISFSITYWKQRERQLAAERRRIDRFTKYLAHDLRTPLQVAYGALERARAGDDAAFEKVAAAHEQMREIVDDLSGLSGTAGRVDGAATSAYDAVSVGIASTHLVPLVEETWGTVAPDEATLSVEVPADTVVVTRTETLRPVVESLLKNAVEHAGSGVTVRVGLSEDRGIVVEDDGPGLPESVANRLSADGVPTSFEAIGTGLLTVAETVEQQGWGLSVSESPEGGARFELTGCPVVTDTLVTADEVSSVPLSANADVGPVSREGSASYESETGTWRVTGNGENVWGDTNQFHFVYGRAEPPVRIQGRVTSLDGVDEFSKAGFAVRAGLDPDAPFAYVGRTQSHGSETTWRMGRDGHTDSDQFEERPGAFNWYRVEYGDGVATCYLSEDGEEWRPVDQRRIDLGDTVALGLLVCSHDTDRTCEATFGDVSASRLESTRRR